VPDKAGMDIAFQDVFSEYNLQQRLEILGYGSRDAYLEAKPTIAAKAKDMVTHYLTHVFPNGFKAQIVATSREAAARYKEYIDAALAEALTSLEKANPENIDLDCLRKMKTDVIISGSHNDELHLKPYTDGSKHKTSIKSFKLPFNAEDEGISGDTGILIVNNMLLTGFDAPVEQVMYLDKPSTPMTSGNRTKCWMCSVFQRRSCGNFRPAMPPSWTSSKSTALLTSPTTTPFSICSMMKTSALST
jgi:type I restriction enzyme, R subunit